MSGRFGIDIDDIEQALEIACGDAIGSEVTSRRTATERDVSRLRGRVKRFLMELPGDVSVSELTEILDNA